MAGVGCKGASCAQKTKFDPSKSSSSKQQKGNFKIQYGDGSSVEGPIFTETVSVAGVKVTGQFFSPVTTMADSFGDDPIDGVSAFIKGFLGELRGFVAPRVGIPCYLQP